MATNGGEGVAASIVLGALGLGAGLLAIDHYYSPKGHSAFDKLTSKLTHLGGHHVGADAPAWASELSKLPPFVVTTIQKALASETDQGTLNQLAQNLSAAGYTQTAAAVRAKSGGAPASTAIAKGAW